MIRFVIMEASHVKYLTEKKNIIKKTFVARKVQNNYDLQGADNASSYFQCKQCETFIPLTLFSGPFKSFNSATAFRP